MTFSINTDECYKHLYPADGYLAPPPTPCGSTAPLASFAIELTTQLLLVAAAAEFIEEECGNAKSANQCIDAGDHNTVAKTFRSTNSKVTVGCKTLQGATRMPPNRAEDA